MYRSADTRQLSVLLRISSDLDIIGDVTARVDNPADLLAWASTLPEPTICAWRATSGKTYVQVSSHHDRAPIHGLITAVLSCEHHGEYWNTLVQGNDPKPGQQQPLHINDLSSAWDHMPSPHETNP
jgi:hypothetical protein